MNLDARSLIDENTDQNTVESGINLSHTPSCSYNHFKLPALFQALGHTDMITR